MKPHLSIIALVGSLVAVFYSLDGDTKLAQKKPSQDRNIASVSEAQASIDTYNSLPLQLNLIEDEPFSKGFKVKSPTPGSINYVNTFQVGPAVGQAPFWEIAQWYSKSSLIVQPVEVASGVYSWKDDYKEVMWGDVGTENEGVTLSVNSYNEYNNQFRKGNVKDWIHLYIDQNLIPKKEINLDVMSELKLQFDIRLLEFEEFKGTGYNPNIHANQIVMYFLGQNLNPSSPGYGGDFVNYGLNIFDSRAEFTNSYTMIDPDGGHIIYVQGYKDFSQIPIRSKQWIKFDRDILPDIRKAVNLGISRNIFKSPLLKDYSIGSTNMGFEIMGLGKFKFQIKNFRLIAKTLNNPIQYDFIMNNSQNWKSNCFVLKTSKRVDYGVLNVKSSMSKLPSFIQNTELRINADQFKKINISAKFRRSGARKAPKALKIFWINDNGGYSDENSMVLPISYDWKYHQYVADLRSHPNWNGKISGLKLQFADIGNKAHAIFDSITFSP